MQIHRDLSALPSIRNPVITTGSFDGVHAGHQKLFSRIASLAGQYHGESVVVTFDPHPREVIFPRDESLKLLTSTAEKMRYFEIYGIDHAVVIPFTIEFSQQGPREYIEKFLLETLNVKCLVVGYDHRFGLNRAGDFKLLREYEEKGLMDVVLIDKQEVDHIAVSSTRIREAVSLGDIERANKLLGHSYGLRGRVIKGARIGNQLGFPTANIKLDSAKKLLPPHGIYAGYAHSNGDKYRAMLYIGDKPSIQNKSGDISIEAHLMNFDGDLYDSEIRVEFIARIRKDEKYQSLSELREAIRRDEEQITRVIESHEQRKDPSVTIAALNYNGESILGQCLPSWTDSGIPQSEYLLIDNNSSDQSMELVRSDFRNFNIVELPDNLGFAGGYNQGLKNVSTKYLALVNSDVVLTKDWLKPVIEHMEAHPDVAVCQPKILDQKRPDTFEYAGACGGFIDSLGIPFCAGRILDTVEQDEGQYDNLREIFWASGAAFVIRTRIFNDFGGFDESYFAHMEEIDLCWRIKQAGFRISVVPSSVVYHIGGSTLTYNNPKKVYLNFRNNLSTIIKNSRGADLLWILPVRFILDLGALLHFSLQIKFSHAAAIIHAYASLLFRLPALIRNRAESRRTIREFAIGKSNNTGILRGSILWQYYVRKVRRFSSLRNI